MTTQPNPGNIKPIVDTLKTALNPERQDARASETLSDAQVQLVRNLRRRTGIITVVEGDKETETDCVIEEREHGVLTSYGLPDGWWLVYSKDIPIEWDEDVNSPPDQSRPEPAPNHIARPLPTKGKFDGPTHVFDSMHRSIEADDFFSGSGRHKWYAKRFNPVGLQSEVDAPQFTL